MIENLQKCNKEKGNVDVNEEDLLTQNEDIISSTCANFVQAITGVFAAYNSEEQL